MKLHLLGVNGPFPESRGATSGYLLEAGGSLFQFDLGSGVLSRLTGLTPPESISALFLSHWHYDHAADLPVLMYRLQALKKQLPVYGPADPSSPLFRLVTSENSFSFTELAPGKDLCFGQVRIRVTGARHPVPTVGFRIDCNGKSIGYTGDTNTLPSLAHDFSKCSLLLADALFPADSWSEEKPHLSAALAAELAEEAGAVQLVLSHLNPFFAPELLLQEARAIHGCTALAEAGASWNV